MDLYSYFFKIDSKDLRFLRPHGNLNNIPIGLPILKYTNNHTIHSIICKFRDDLWLYSIYGAVKLLGIREINTINNYLLEDYDTMDDEDKKYVDSLLEDLDKLSEEIDIDDRIAYVWSKF